MFRLSRDFPSCINHLVGFLINNQNSCSGEILEKVRRWIDKTIQDNLEHNNDYEIAWCLLAAGALKIKIDCNSWLRGKPNSVIFALLGMLAKRELLSTTINKFDWKAGFYAQSVYGEYWLPYYEAVRRGWTKDTDVIKAVTQDHIFKSMLDNQVTFLEDRVFDAAHIDLSHRSFSKRKASRSNKKFIDSWLIDY